MTKQHTPGLTYLVPDAKTVTEKHKADAVVLIVFRGDQYATASYGKDRKTCEAWRPVCDQIHEMIADGAIQIPTEDLEHE